MTQESLNSPEVRKEGTRWLEALGYGHLAGQVSLYEQDGVPMLWDDYIELGGDRARPIMAGLEALGPEDPRSKKTVEMLVSKYIQPYLPSQAESTAPVHQA